MRARASTPLPQATALLPLDAARGLLGEYVYDFYCCARCGRLITQPEMLRGLQRQDRIEICPCGGMKFTPAAVNIGVRWYHWLLPRVLGFAWLRWRGRA